MGRIVILVATVVAAAFALRTLVWQPYRCNIEKRYFDAQTVAAESQPGWYAASAAERNITGLRKLEKRCPNDLEVVMLLAQNHLLLQQRGDAINYYQRALRISRRPEIYQLLGEAQAAAGRRREAIDNLLMAQRADPHYRDTTAQRLVLEAELRDSSAH